MKNLLLILFGGAVGYGIATSKKNTGKPAIVDDYSNAVLSDQTLSLIALIKKNYYTDAERNYFTEVAKRMLTPEIDAFTTYLNKYQYSSAVPEDLKMKMRAISVKYGILKDVKNIY